MSAEAGRKKRIVLIGAECTGKSTLTRALAAHYGEPWSDEYVRHHVEKLDRPLAEIDLEPIARGQVQLEDQAFARASKLVFHDTNLLSSIIYAEYYFNVRIQWVDKLFESRIYDHYFLCQPDIPWESDPGQRVSAAERTKLQSLFEMQLREYEIPFVPLAGTLENRVAKTVACLGE